MVSSITRRPQQSAFRLSPMVVSPLARSPCLRQTIDAVGGSRQPRTLRASTTTQRTRPCGCSRSWVEPAPPTVASIAGTATGLRRRPRRGPILTSQPLVGDPNRGRNLRLKLAGHSPADASCARWRPLSPYGVAKLSATDWVVQALAAFGGLRCSRARASLYTTRIRSVSFLVPGAFPSRVSLFPPAPRGGFSSSGSRPSCRLTTRSRTPCCRPWFAQIHASRRSFGRGRRRLQPLAMPDWPWGYSSARVIHEAGGP